VACFVFSTAHRRLCLRLVLSVEGLLSCGSHKKRGQVPFRFESPPYFPPSAYWISDRSWRRKPHQSTFSNFFYYVRPPLRFSWWPAIFSSQLPNGPLLNGDPTTPSRCFFASSPINLFYFLDRLSGNCVFCCLKEFCLLSAPPGIFFCSHFFPVLPFPPQRPPALLLLRVGFFLASRPRISLFFFWTQVFFWHF